VQVFSEPVILNDTTPAPLANESVVAASITVSNEARTQVFVEGIDYRLLEVGLGTSIQRLLGSNILDGETVVADYEYRTTGTAEFKAFNSNLRASVNFLEYFRARVGYSFADTTVQSGELKTPTNNRKIFDVVLNADFPVGRWSLTGEYRFKDHDADISSSKQNSLAIGTSTNLFRSMRFDLSAGISRVDNEESIEDIDQITFRLGLSGRVSRRGSFSYDASYLRDVGGSLAREQLQHQLQYQWRYRLVSFSLRAVLTDDMLGATEKRSSRVTALVQRVFR
jgi:hypothetical protein